MTPQTAAGRALLAQLERGEPTTGRAAILAIEAEALAAARERIEAIPVGDGSWWTKGLTCVERSAVLAALVAPDAPEKP